LVCNHIMKVGSEMPGQLSGSPGSSEPASGSLDRRRLRELGAILLLAAVYFAAGSFGLSFASINPSASAVWPPSGIALAALVLWGRRLWPGVFIGAFAVNLIKQGSIWTALAIASGNSLEPVAGAFLV